MALLPAISIVVLVGLFVALGTATISKSSSNAQVGFWTQVWRKTIYAFVVLPIKLSVDLAKYVANQMGIHYEAFVEMAIVWLFGLEEQAAFGGIFVYKHAAQFHRFADWLLNHKLPKERKATADLAVQQALIKAGKLTPLGAKQRYQAKATLAAQRKTIEGIVLDDLTHDARFRAAIAADLPLATPLPGVRGGVTKAQVRAWVKQYAAALIAAAGIAVPFPRGGLAPAIPRPQAKTNTDVNKRIKRLEKTVGALGLLAGVSVATLTEIGKFMRCPNTRGIRKAWCGADLTGLLGLIGGIAVLEANVSLVDMAKALLAVEDYVVEGILSELTEFQGVTL